MAWTTGFSQHCAASRWRPLPAVPTAPLPVAHGCPQAPKSLSLALKPTFGQLPAIQPHCLTVPSPPSRAGGQALCPLALGTSGLCQVLTGPKEGEGPTTTDPASSSPLSEVSMEAAWRGGDEPGPGHGGLHRLLGGCRGGTVSFTGSLPALGPHPALGTPAGVKAWPGPWPTRDLTFLASGFSSVKWVLTVPASLTGVQGGSKQRAHGTTWRTVPSTRGAPAPPRSSVVSNPGHTARREETKQLARWLQSQEGTGQKDHSGMGTLQRGCGVKSRVLKYE